MILSNERAIARIGIGPRLDLGLGLGIGLGYLDTWTLVNMLCSFILTWYIIAGLYIWI
jgi:hypothetical protein